MTIGVTWDAETGISAMLIRWAFFEFATGDWTLSEWAKHAETQGVKPKKISWQKIFRNPFYTGCEGSHDAIIEQSVFDEVQKVLDKKIAEVYFD